MAHDTDRPVTTAADTLGTADRAERRELRRRQEEKFGGIKPGAAFFGWLTATGMAVLLTALVAAVGAGVGLVSDASDVVDATGASNEEIGWAGVVLVLVVVLLSYYAGGYVAGRMARFDGIRQGVAVFAWAVVAAVVVAVLSAVAGAKYDVLDQLNSFPRIPGSLSDVTLQAGVALVGVVVVALVGAMAGGLAGMHFHRRVDRADLSA